MNLAKGMDDRLTTPIQRGMHKEGLGIAKPFFVLCG
jgi:hypothetical protein